VQGEADRPKRGALYRRIQEKVREDLPVVPLYNDVLFAASRTSVQGFAPDPQFTMSLYGVTVGRA
jgi:ABC-type transport system substrate-binding protein